jgi:DNA-binding IclR family transcriptional regulator
MLERDRRSPRTGSAAPVLSLAHAMRTGSPILQIAGPLMRKEAEQRHIGIGLAVADRDEMVYLESVRYSRRVAWRNVVAGQRVPMELTSLGRAWLSVATDEQRRNLMDQFRERRSTGWRELARDIAAAIDSVREARLLLGVVATAGGGAGHAGRRSRSPGLRVEHEHLG